MAYSDTDRKKCVIAFQAGKTVAQISRRYNIPHATITTWVKNPDKHLAEDSWDFESLNHGSQSDTFKSVKTPDIRPDGNTVLVIPDLHCPWENKDALAFLIAVREKYKPNLIVNLGDEVDFYGMSRFDHDPDVINPGGELSLAVKHLIPFYREFPNVLICQSNHTHRVHAKAQKSGLPASTIKSIEEILKTPEGWVL